MALLAAQSDMRIRCATALRASNCGFCWARKWIASIKGCYLSQSLTGSAKMSLIRTKKPDSAKAPGSGHS